MAHPSTDAEYLNHQYDDSDELHVRIETHRRFTAAVSRRIEAIIAREGVYRVPKTFGYFVADL